MFMLLLVGGLVSKASAVNVKYYIVNKSGMTLDIYKTIPHNDGDLLKIPDELKSPYIPYEDYKYFKSAAEAKAYYTTGDDESAITTYSELETATDVYVGYTYNGYTPEGLPVLASSMDDAIRYHVIFPAENYYLFVHYQDYYNNLIAKTATDAYGVHDIASAVLQFAFVSENKDPYDMRMVTPYYPDGGLSANSSNMGNDKLRMAAEDWNSNDINRFFIKKNGDNYALCAVAVPNSDEKLIYLSKSGEKTNLQNKAQNELGNDQKISITPLSLFHIIRADGKIGISAYSDQKELSSGIPATIKSPAMDKGQYRFFKTREAAQQYTATQSVVAEQLYDENAVIEPGSTIYVGYNFVNDPTKLDLSGTRWYRIRGNDANSVYRYFTKESTKDNLYIKSYTDDSSDYNTITTTYPYFMMFKFWGNDPYDIVVQNGYGYEDGKNYYLKGSSKTVIQPSILLTQDINDIYHMVALNHMYAPDYCTLVSYVEYEGNDNSYENISYYKNKIGQPVARDYDKNHDSYGYLRKWGQQNTNSNQNVVMSVYTKANQDVGVNNTSVSPIPSYYTAENLGKLIFEPVQFETTFHIIGKSGREAISYTGMFDADMPLNYENLPAAIRSPYLEKETLTFKDAAGNVMERTPMTKGTNIYVTYTTDYLAENPITLSNTDIANYNLIVNGQYVYEANGTIASDANEDVAPNYLWNIMGEDPYAVKIRNVNVSDQLLAFDTTSGNLSFGSGSNFILMGGTDGKYEIMAATGGNVNADTNSYNIGYSAAAGGIKLYNDYAHGADEIQAQLEVYKPGATYHIIDKQHKEILSENIENQVVLGLPEGLVSPLVTQYHYWKKDAFILDNEDNPTTFTLKEGQTEITSVAEATVNKKTDIYVTYDVDETMLSTSEEIANGNRKKYRLKFLDEQNKTVYPYANEEIKLDLFGDEQFEADTKSSAITRTNWGWYLESELKDPYHIKMVSAAHSENWGDGDRLYMHTSTADEKTSATIDTPTDYMLLGAEGAYLLAFGDQKHIVKSIGETSVGNGAFDITELILQPTLILLDRHGWEIMRKPLPAAIGKENVIEPDLDAINAYNSPMVKAYKFYRSAAKTVGYHKFEVSDPIMEAGKTYTATSLTGLPASYYSMGDNIYVIYDVKEEYENTYLAAVQYLIQQGEAYATATEGANAIALTNLPDDDIPDKMLWRVKPNLDIDKEMGYDGEETYDNVFDPYNLQIQNVAYSTFFTTNATGAKVDATASMEGTYPSTGMTVTLTNGTSPVEGAGQGGVTLRMTNATFMAVQDADGNIHLMPRFDHGHVISGVGSEITLAEPSAAAEQITQLQRLQMYTYIIVDNSGHEALRYKGKVGEEYPQIPSHLKSPMAKDFRFYQDFVKLGDDSKNLRSISLGTDIPFYDGEYSLEDIADKEITGSFITAGVSDDTQPIYVRYAYDEEGDKYNLLSEGDWHNTTIGGNTSGNTEADEWKFIRNATTEDPDPYNVVLYHREGNTASGNHYAFLANGDDDLSLVLARQGSTSEYEFLSNLKTGETTTIKDFAENGYPDNGSQSQVKITFENATFNSPKYYIITNDGTLALIAKSHHEEASESPLLPEWARSPLLNDGDYMYYADATEEGGKYTVVEANRTNNLCGLPQDIVYVRYNYNKETTPFTVADTWQSQLDGTVKVNINYSTFDITGGTWYNMEYMYPRYGSFTPSLILSRKDNSTNFENRDQGNHDRNIDGFLCDFYRDNTGYIGVQSCELFMFKLDGGDPYAIKIYNLYKYKQDEDLLFSINKSTEAVQMLEESENHIQSFMLLKKESGGNERRHLLVATGHPNIYVKLRDNGGLGGVFLDTAEGDLPESGTPLRDLDYDDVRALTFYKAPSMGNYTFHGIRYNDEGTAPYSLDENGKPKVTWTAKLRRNWLTQVKLEEDLMRLYALYEKENTTNEFVSYAEAGIGRFYADPELTQEIEDNVYPEIEEGDDYDIYFKYTVASEELSELTSTWEDVAKDVEAYYTENATRGKLRQGNVNAKWSFMVLDTDENITTDADGNTVGEQYFLYRRDDGKVGWMDNASSLHKDTKKNRKNWTCHRLAEWYKQGDNDAFREGRWLWTFIGDDPYNIHVLNMESAVGVTPEAQGVYALEKGVECYAIVTEKTDKDSNKTYPVSIPEAKPTENYGWGLCPGYGSENTFSLQLPMTDDKCYPLYWRMATDKEKPDSVAGMVRENNRSAAIQLIRYIPVLYEDVNLTIRRDDEVAKYIDEGIELDDMVTGISKLYFAESERMFVAGDEIDTNKPEMLPLSVRRAFCDYTFYSDKFRTEGGKYTVTAGPYPNHNEPVFDDYGSPLRDEDGRIIYHYYYIDPETGEYSNPADGAQSIYASYTVTSDMFLKTAPTKEQVAEMVNNNDHVYFMDFPELNQGQTLAYNTGHHAYFEKNATFRDQTGDVTKNGITEKKKWDPDTEQFVNDIEQVYNYREFNTTTNRMTTAPEDLKWYFVGDPYKVQVYNTAGEWGSNNAKENPQTVAANLCRFDETETNFQFVVDCVHLRVPDKSNIDNREYIDFYDEYGKPTGEKVYNRGYKRPYYDDFYWEVVPAVSDVEGSFALRFKEDNDLLGYRNVYYYLAHDGLTKRYRSSENNTDYNVNLSYETNNDLYPGGVYEGYHKANNKNTAIKLTQPVKVYVSAKKAGTAVTKDELSEYYGYGESITEVPRHLQRKYVKYETPTVANPWKLLDGDNGTDCKHKDNVFDTETTYKCNRTYRYDVTYTLDEKGKNIFTPQNSQEYKWLDVAVNGNWLYYDKFGGDENKLSNYTSVVNGGNGWNDGLKGLHWAFIGDPYDFTILNRRQHADNTAGKYLAGTKLTIEDFKNVKDSVIWTTSLQATDEMNPAEVTQYDHNHTSVATANAEVNTHWSLQMWKTGGDKDFFLRTASLKTGYEDLPCGYKPSDKEDPNNINQTNNYWRMVAKQYKGNNIVSDFNLVPYSLSDKDSYNSDLASGNYSATMSGLGATQQKIDIRTVTDEDKDDAANDCFDATVSVVSKAGEVRIKEQKGLEISYGDDKATASDMMPQTLRRYGCTYRCYVGYESAANPGTEIEKFNSNDFKTHVAVNGEPIKLTYVYEVTDSVSQFFTSEEDAAMDEFTWLFAYFKWLQSYSGSYVEVEKTRQVFDHYVYNAAGIIIDVVYREEKYTEIVENPSESVPTSSYLDTHNQQNGIFCDESMQSDDDRLKWSLVGDPYSFTMKNYAQYLENPNAATMVDEKGNVITSNLGSTYLTIVEGKDGKPYLAIVDEHGNFLELISFDSDSDKSLHTSKGSGINNNDPTGNSMNANNVKEFWLTNLLKYADLVTYHLVMAHQHSLDYNHQEGKLNQEQQKNIETHLDEFKKYWGIHLANDSNHYFNVEDESGNVTEDKTEIVKKLLIEKGTLRDMVNDTIADADATRVGIGNRLSVPWYMKRQFCTYTMYQRDIQEAVPVEGDSTIIQWKSIFDWKEEDGDSQKPSGYDDGLKLQGKPITRLADCHRNRRVIVDVIYEVAPDRFRFATQGCESTAWYQMMNTISDGKDILMNFSYKDRIGSKADRTQHYTNDYLWAPQGDPYGFVLRSRYATINGGGWNDVVVTADKDANDANDANASSTSDFNDMSIVQNDSKAKNAVYEMFNGNPAYSNAFIMHPVAAKLDDDDADCESYYMVVNTENANSIELTQGKLTDLKNNPNANWQLTATAEQLLPYFDRAGYVGGLDPAKAQNFSNMDIRAKLRNSIDTQTQPDFAVICQAQDVVYQGTFGEGGKPFTSTNLINMKRGYYRIKAFSEDALSREEKEIGGITGPRYISGYRFESEKNDALNLHFFETSMDSATIHTFGQLRSIENRTLDDHPSMKGNIEVLPADFDPSSIFHFTGDGKYTIGTQGLKVYAEAGKNGKTKMGEVDGEDMSFYVEDIGGTAMTVRTDDDLKTTYLEAADYAIACNKNNELQESDNGIQTTKWLLQPVGTKEEWPYNEMPLRVEVQKGGMDARNVDMEDPYYYGSLYVPFDTRLERTTDAAFTMTMAPQNGQNFMPSVSQLNGLGNPQYVPAEWRVILRTNSPREIKLNNADKYYVDMYLPYDSPQNVNDEAIQLKGSYLEKMLTATDLDLNEGDNVDSKTVMVFGVPFIDHDGHDYNRDKKSVGFYTNHNWARETAPNEDVKTTSARNNKYVYHNKVYYILNEPYDSNAQNHSIIAFFYPDGVPNDDEDQESLDAGSSTPWPCDVYDVHGRRVAQRETPETLRKNHPELPKGIYIFGHQKVMVK